MTDLAELVKRLRLKSTVSHRQLAALLWEAADALERFMALEKRVAEAPVVVPELDDGGDVVFAECPSEMCAKRVRLLLEE